MSLAELIIDLQFKGLRINAPFERRPGGAGPSDAGMVWIEGTAVTVPVDASFVADSPYSLEPEDVGFGIYAGGIRLAGAAHLWWDDGRNQPHQQQPGVPDPPGQRSQPAPSHPPSGLTQVGCGKPAIPPRRARVNVFLRR